jgi:hypothetical protein
MPLRLTHFGASEVRATAELTSKLNVTKGERQNWGSLALSTRPKTMDCRWYRQILRAWQICDATASLSPGCGPFAARR